ncbi:ABC transporter ATP-binding protein [Paenibacillus hunanensis]|uniref:ATP-binding cassette subfamily B protein n=1 Tax=Paenibacillus hunanensis TaxID=539262 RepID=A0ABU1J1C4_9BACL|nr:ABC transporter ATP-binding protein [Paenibacillus hunanensis]MDR6244298.1 ATP-binding cassette subfamily B protein [Paenibacillus hunanensis]GGJ17833.1 ABC transporter [Paenibacillus hunanensis]
MPNDISYGKTTLRLLAYFKPFKFKVLLVLLLVLVSSAVSVVSAAFLRLLIDDFIVPLIGNQNPVFHALLQALVILAVIYLAGTISTFISKRLMITISQRIMKHIRDELFRRMQKLPLRYFDRKAHGDVMSHYTNDVDTLNMMLTDSLPQILSTVVTLIVVLGTMLYIDIPLTIIVLLGAGAMLWTTKKIGTQATDHFFQQQESIGVVDGYIEEMMHGQKVVQVFGREEHVTQQFARLNDDLFHRSATANKYANLLMPLNENLATLTYVAVAIIGGAMAISGWDQSLTLGSIAAFLSLSRSFTMPIAEISSQVSMFVVALAGAKRIFTLMDEQPEEDHGLVTLQKNDADHPWSWKLEDGSLVPLQGKIEFKQVSFSYDGKKQVLIDMTLTAQPGQKLAFVGATGAGKTTVTNLLNRFYEISDGEILYDGISIQRIRKADLRRSLGIVLQDTHLFTGTVADNIRYGHLEASDEQVMQAARMSHAANFIERLPDGYDTRLDGSGNGLSQGQSQLLAIARAAIANPPVMILDEATSSIDTRTEALVQSGMDNLMQGRTVFVIAHRLSTVRNSDAILVMEQGRITERGDHDELIQLKGNYYQLYTGVFEWQ